MNYQLSGSPRSEQGMAITVKGDTGLTDLVEIGRMFPQDGGGFIVESATAGPGGTDPAITLTGDDPQTLTETFLQRWVEERALVTSPGPNHHVNPDVADQVEELLTTPRRRDTGAPFFDDDGYFLGPEEAAAHVLLIQGGFTTAEIEAERMIKDGGVMAERARAWLAGQET
jgi:hypothetical protein